MSSIRPIILYLSVFVIFLSTISVDALSDVSSQLLSDSSTLRQEEATLSGYVTDTLMNPLSGALVRVYFHETYRENYSDPLGYYQVTNIPICYCLKNATCSKPGYHSEWVLLSIGGNMTYNFILTALNQTCYPVFNGTTGTNGWYISCVTVTFVVNEDIDAVFFKIDDGSWIEYSNPFVMCENGMHMLYYRYSYQGNVSEVQSTPLGIDCNKPQLQLFSDRISLNKIKISAEATDETSGIDRLEFFVDGNLSLVDYTPPYEVYVIGFGIHHVKVVAFDCAGNLVNSTITTIYSSQSHSYYFHSFLYRIFSLHPFMYHMRLINDDAFRTLSFVQ